MKLRLTAFQEKYAICRLSPFSALPHWLMKSEFFSVTKTQDELSIVAIQNDNFPDDTVCSRNWRVLKIEGPLDLTLIGLIAEVSGILKDAGIPIFTLSTYDTDYILVKDDDLGIAVRALESFGHELIMR
jgi:hypothetical protein